MNLHSGNPESDDFTVTLKKQRARSTGKTPGKVQVIPLNRYEKISETEAPGGISGDALNLLLLSTKNN